MIHQCTCHHKRINKEDFLRFVTVKKRLSKNSIRHCTYRFNSFSRWLKENDKKLNKETIEDFFEYLLKERKLKNSSMNTYYFFLKQLKEYCEDRGINDKFLKGFKCFPTYKTHIEILAPEEIEKLIIVKRVYSNRNGADNSNLGFLYSTLIMFIAFTGCRLNEATSLTIDKLDLTLGKALFIETKNKRTREVFISEPLMVRLKRLIELRSKEDLVFLSTTRKKIIPQAFERELKIRAKLVGITKRVYPHLFRHSFATQLLISGVDITVVASILGHVDIQTTFGNYIHLADKTRRQGMFRHPLIRRSIDPMEVIKSIKETLESFHLDDDKRFNYSFQEINGGIQLSINTSKM
jgi:integrase/recombinase XerD